jgi:hypothetical protein
MSKLRNSASSLHDQPTDFASHMRDRGDELIAQAVLKLARYPADVNEQIADLLRVLIAKPGEAESKFDNDLPNYLGSQFEKTKGDRPSPRCLPPFFDLAFSVATTSYN